ncbi:hypothetical protein ACYX7E_13485 [Luteimonas sp. RIT-PG2_3]
MSVGTAAASDAAATVRDTTIAMTPRACGSRSAGLAVFRLSVLQKDDRAWTIGACTCDRCGPGCRHVAQGKEAATPWNLLTILLRLPSGARAVLEMLMYLYVHCAFCLPFTGMHSTRHLAALATDREQVLSF